MSRFYASIQGSAGEATRQGHANTGITGHVRGWHVGARVDVSDENGVDVVRVFRTGGSSDPHGTLIAEFRSDD
jgi:hypothetical protein